MKENFGRRPSPRAGVVSGWMKVERHWAQALGSQVHDDATPEMENTGEECIGEKGNEFS